MEIQVKLYRPFDRDPDDHLYGALFDNELSKIIGGAQNWSSELPDRSKTPKAKVNDAQIEIELHEDGPLIKLLIDNLDQIPIFISSIASIISAWAAVMAVKKKDSKKDEYQKKSGTIIQIGKNKFESEEDLNPNEVKDIATFIAGFTFEKES